MFREFVEVVTEGSIPGSGSVHLGLMETGEWAITEQLLKIRHRHDIRRTIDFRRVQFGIPCRLHSSIYIPDEGWRRQQPKIFYNDKDDDNRPFMIYHLNIFISAMYLILRCKRHIGRRIYNHSFLLIWLRWLELNKKKIIVCFLLFIIGS